MNPLTDLDELVLLCRDQRARNYIREATSCYRAGAFRAAIVATWVAVCYDIIDKLRELALAGDKSAEAFVASIEGARQSNDVVRSLKLERELLEVAKDRFELISHLECIDLERLQQDRNRCAHPSLVSDEQAFEPPGELARLHIRSAVMHLLQHPPAQGKHALERLLREVDSEYFPMDGKQAAESLSVGPLRRPRPSLVRNFAIILLKRAMGQSGETARTWMESRRIFAALDAVRLLHPQPFEGAVVDALPPLLRALGDHELDHGLDVVRNVHGCWQLLPVDVVSRFEHFIELLPSGKFGLLEFLVRFAPLERQVFSRVSRASRAELMESILFSLEGPLGERAVDVYLQSKSFEEANQLASWLSNHVGDLHEGLQRRLLTSIAQNEQVLHSYELGPLLSHLRQSKVLSADAFESLLRSSGLSRFASPAGEA